MAFTSIGWAKAAIASDVLGGNSVLNCFICSYFFTTVILSGHVIGTVGHMNYHMTVT